MKIILKSLILMLGMLMFPSAVYAQNIYGDVNGDLEVNIADVNAVIDVILNDATILTADVNQDGEINIADINVIISVILGNQPKTLYSTILVTTSDGVTVEHLIDQNTHVSIEKPNLIIETDGNVLTYDLEQMARLRYGHRYVTAGLTLDRGVPQQEDGVVTDGDDRPQYALFTYRNDDDFNAFLNIDVDSITYCNTDLNGVAHGNAVMQQVWTPDSLYRIPLAAIDSICFKAPETKLKDDVFFITDEHIPYTISVDTLSMIFKTSIPQSMLPSVGNVLVSETFESPFEDGFVGRVTDVIRSGQSIEVICEDANLFDIYEQLIAVGKFVTDSTEAPGNAPRRSQKRILGFDDVDKSGIYTFNPGKVTVKKSGWDWISLEYTPELSVDYVLYIHKDDPTHIKLAITGKHDAALVVDCELPNKIEYNHEVWPCDVPLPSFYGFKPTFKVGLFFKSGAKAHVKGKIPVVISHTLGVEYHGSGHFDINDVNIIKSFDMDFNEPTLDFKLDGYVTFGLCADVGVKFLHQKVASIDAILKMGPKITTSFDLSVNDIANDPGIYSVLKNTKVSLDFDMGINAKYRILKKEAQIKPGKGWPGVTNVNQWEDTPYPVDLFQWSWPLFECYLMPEFKSHVINSYNGSNLTFVTNASREVFLPVKLGARIESTQSVGQQTTLMNPRTYWISSRDTWAKNYETTFSTMSGENYTCRPIVEFLGCQIEASPEVTASTNEQTVTMEEGETKVVDAPVANGNYTVKSFNTSVVSCTVNGSKITVTAHQIGSTYLQVTNTNDNSNYFIHVTVTESYGTSVISVSPTSIDFGDVARGQTATNVLSIANDSDVPQTVTVEVTPPFSIAHNESSMSSLTVEVPGNSCTPVTILFKASQEDDYLGTATFTSNAIVGGSCVVPLHARGVTDVEPQTEIITIPGTGVSFKMVAVEGGTFTMGETDGDGWSGERPAHQVTISSFAIGQTEVTQALWQAVMGSNPSEFTGDLNRPVEQVSWNDCQTFITKLNEMTGRHFRLPTEAEWEFAARGGTLSRGYKYSGSNDLNEVAWYWDNSSDGTKAVATKTPNELGLYDMSGNVWEWCSDWYGDYSSDAQTNPTGPETGSTRVNRGGSWGNDTRHCRVSYRDYWGPHINLGLRLALDPNVNDGHEYVDLGLPSGTLWATCNVGASAPEEYGDYFAWGETESKDYYDWNTYKWCNGSYDTMSKYCTNRYNGYNGFTDGKTELDPEDDAAYGNWGSSWRIPTKAQQDELRDNCTWTWTTCNGVEGSLVTGPNGNSIFLPAAGCRWDEFPFEAVSCGDYWSRTLHSVYSDSAYGLSSDSTGVYLCFGSRNHGFTVRPVRVSEN